jgi:hypothetical protein
VKTDLVDNLHLEYKNAQFPYKMLLDISSSFCSMQLDCTPFPVTVIGVTVVDARGTRTGVPAAATPGAATAAAKTAVRICCLMFKDAVNCERVSRLK